MSVSQQLMNQALEAGKQLNEIGIRMVPSNTHFRLLLSTMEPCYVSQESVENQFEKVVSDQTQIQSINGMDFTTQQEQFIDAYVRSCVNRIATLRRQIIPFVDKVISNVEGKYQTNKIEHPEVRTIKVADIFFDKTLTEFVERHANFVPTLGNRDIKLVAGWTARSEDELLKLITTGSSHLNSLILDLLATHEPGWLVEVYNKYFVKGGIFSTYYDIINSDLINEELLICYIITGALINLRVIDGSIALSMRDLEAMMAESFSLMGGMLNKVIYQLNHHRVTGRVIRSYNQYDLVVYVDKDNYEDYIALGGDVEAVIGAAVQRQINIATKKDLLDNQQNYRAAYHQFIGGLKDQLEAKASLLLKETIPTALMDEFNAETAELKNLFLYHIPLNEGESIDVFHLTPNQLKLICDKITGAILSKPLNALREAIAYGIIGVGLARWNFYLLYQRLNEIMETTPDQNPREVVFSLILEELSQELIRQHVHFSQ